MERFIAEQAEITIKQERLRLHIALYEQKVKTILAGLKIPYSREPNEEQKIELHRLKCSIGKVKRDLDRGSSSLDSLARQKTMLSKSIASMKASNFVKRSECIESVLLAKCSNGPPMVLGRGLGHCTTLGEAGNASAKLNMILARSELELERRALPLRHTIGAERRTRKTDHAPPSQ